MALNKQYLDGNENKVELHGYIFSKGKVETISYKSGRTAEKTTFYVVQQTKGMGDYTSYNAIKVVSYAQDVITLINDINETNKQVYVIVSGILQKNTFFNNGKTTIEYVPQAKAVQLVSKCPENLYETITEVYAEIKNECKRDNNVVQHSATES